MKKLIILLMILHGVTELFSQKEQSEVIHNVSVEEFKKVLDSLHDEVVVDLRTPDEIKQGKIPGSVEINFYEPGFKPAIAALDRNKVYLLYCGSGGRSGETSGLMKKMGFKNLYNLEGGFRMWVKRKMPVSKE